MSKQSSSRNHRGKKLRPNHSLRVFLLVAVSIWLVYQLTRSYGKRRAVVVEIIDSNGVDGELTRLRRLGRKDLVDFAGDVSGDVSGENFHVIRGGGSIVGREGDVEWDAVPDRLSQGWYSEGGDSEKDDEEPDKDDDGLRGGDDEDDKDFHPESGDGEENNELDGSLVPPVNTGGVQDDAAVSLENGASDGTDMAPELNRSLSYSDLSKNLSSDVLLNGREELVMLLRTYCITMLHLEYLEQR